MLSLDQIKKIYDANNLTPQDLSIETFQKDFADGIDLQTRFDKACADLRKSRQCTAEKAQEFIGLFCTDLLYDPLQHYYNERQKFLRFIRNPAWIATFAIVGEKYVFRLYGFHSLNKGRLKMWVYHNHALYSIFKEIRPAEKEYASRNLLRGEYIRRFDRDLMLMEWEKIDDVCNILLENSEELNLPLLMCKSVVDQHTELIWEYKYNTDKPPVWVNDALIFKPLREQTDYVERNAKWDRKLERTLEGWFENINITSEDFWTYVILIIYVLIFAFLLFVPKSRRRSTVVNKI
jgi:hypothetical protein